MNWQRCKLFSARLVAPFHCPDICPSVSNLTYNIEEKLSKQLSARKFHFIRTSTTAVQSLKGDQNKSFKQHARACIQKLLNCFRLFDVVVTSFDRFDTTDSYQIRWANWRQYQVIGDRAVPKWKHFLEQSYIQICCYKLSLSDDCRAYFVEQAAWS